MKFDFWWGVEYHALAPGSPLGEVVAWGEDTRPEGGPCGRGPPVFFLLQKSHLRSDNPRYVVIWVNDQWLF